MRPLYNNQTPPRANKTKRKYYRFLHRGKPCILQILNMQKCFLKNVSASYTFSVSLKFGNFSLNILRKYILVKNEEKGLCPAVRKAIKLTHAPKSHISVKFVWKTIPTSTCMCHILLLELSYSDKGSGFAPETFLQTPTEYQISSYKTQVIVLPIYHFTVVCLDAWPLNKTEAGVDLVYIGTSLLVLCKSMRTASLT